MVFQLRSLEGLMLKLKLQYFGHLRQKTDSFEMTLMLGKIEGSRRRGRQRMIWLDGVTDLVVMGLSRLQELVMDREAWRPWLSKGSDMTERLNWPNWKHCAQSLQSCLTLCDPMDCSPPGSSVRGTLHARILEWVAVSYSRGSSWPRDAAGISYISCIGRQVFCHWHHLGRSGTKSFVELSEYQMR